jgi:hypothetical protein
MNLLAQKNDLIHWIEGLEDNITLQEIIRLKEKSENNSEFLNSLSELERASILKGLEDVKNGNTLPHSEVRKKYEKWL